MDEAGKKSRYATAVSFAYLASFSVGTAIGFNSPVQEELESQFPNITYSLFGSLITLGALFGSLLAGILVERCGRAGSILISTLFSTGGWVLILVRQNVEMLYLARFLLGLSAGINCNVIPIYISEVTPAEFRGIYCTGHQLSAVTGILAIYILGKRDWLRATPLAFVSFLPVFATTVTIVFMPESPTWLVKQNMPDSMVMKALHYLFGRTAFAEAQRDVLLETKRGERNDFSMAQLKAPEVLRPLLIAFILAGIQQACGINAVIFYTTQIFGAASQKLDASTQTIIVGAVQVLFTFLAAILIDRAGRRVLLLVSGAFSLLGMSMLIAFYILQERRSSVVDHLGWLPATSLSIFVAGYSVGLGPIPWLLMSELLPVRARGAGVGLSVGFNSLCAFMVTKFFPGLKDTIGYSGAFSILAVVIAFSILFVYFFVPETKNKTLEEIEAIFKRPTHLCEAGGAAPREHGCGSARVNEVDFSHHSY